MKNNLKKNSLFLLVSAVLATSVATVAHATEVVNVYSARKEALIKPLLDKFTAESGIKVNLVTGKADALLKRLEVEGRYAKADIFITVDAGRLHRAKTAGVLQPFSSELLKQRVPAALRDSDDYWYGLSQRARTIFYNPEKIDASELSTYENLADEQWKGRLCVRTSDNIYNQSLVSSMIDANGVDATETWANGIVANMARSPAGGDTEQLYAVAAGVCDLTFVNTYYFGRLINSDNEKDNAVAAKLSAFFPNQDQPNQAGRGIHMNVSGAGITKASKHKDNAIKLIEFLSNDESQKWYSAINNEYPVVKSAEVSETLKSLGEFKADDIPLSLLGENNAEAVRLMDRANWK
jgi:iron(III) transport system substrate-binding protein